MDALHTLMRVLAAVAALGVVALEGPVRPAWANAEQDACKNAMNARIQVCTDECTRAALAAASNYVDTNHNVKFGCLKGCAIKQIFQMQACRDGKGAPANDPTETNPAR